MAIVSHVFNLTHWWLFKKVSKRWFVIFSQISILIRIEAAVLIDTSWQLKFSGLITLKIEHKFSSLSMVYTFCLMMKKLKICFKIVFRSKFSWKTCKAFNWACSSYLIMSSIVIKWILFKKNRLLIN